MRDSRTGDLATLFVSGTGGDTRRYRCFHQQEQLAMEGVVTGFCESDDPQLLVDVLDYDVLVLHRVPHSRLIGVVIDVARLHGKPVVFETDDLVFAPELYDRIGLVDTLSPESARELRRNLQDQAQAFERCDCVLAPTDFLAGEARERGKPAYVNRNVPSQEMIRISESAFAGRYQRWSDEDRQPEPLVVGYFSGTGSHNRDFRVVAEPLLWALETYPQVWLHIGGHLVLDPAFSTYQDRVRRAPYVDWRELPHLIAGVDINLAPLERDNPFCRAKSENKFVEAALVGVPTIATAVEAFEFAVTDGEDGVLASTADEWKAALRMLLDSPGRRRAMGEAARRTVYARYMPEQRASGLVGTLRSVVDRYGRPAASTGRILEEWAERMALYAESVQEDALRWEKQVESSRRVVGSYERQMAEKLRRKRQAIERLEGTIEEINRGRVMRLMTSTQRWLRSVRRKLGGP